MDVKKVDSCDVTQKSQSDNTYAALDADQRDRVAGVMDKLLQNVSDLQPAEIVAIGQVKQSLDADKGSPESWQLLGKVWNGLNDLSGFANSSSQFGEFVYKHWPAITALLTSATTTFYLNVA